LGEAAKQGRVEAGLVVHESAHAGVEGPLAGVHSASLRDAPR
jgi:hypothetical protein